MGRRQEQTFLPRRTIDGPPTRAPMLHITHRPPSAMLGSEELRPHPRQRGPHPQEKKQEVLGRQWRKGKPPMLCVARQPLGAASPAEKAMAFPHQRGRGRTKLRSGNGTAWSSPPSPDSRTQSRRDTRTPLFRAAWLAAARARKQPERRAADEWRQKTGSRSRTEKDAAAPEKDILPLAVPWKEPKTIDRSKRSQSERDQYLEMALLGATGEAPPKNKGKKMQVGRDGDWQRDRERGRERGRQQERETERPRRGATKQHILELQRRNRWFPEGMGVGDGCQRGWGL